MTALFAALLALSPVADVAQADGYMLREPGRWHTAPLITTFGGRRTACGLRLHVWTVGVAHRRLPCGTLITFRTAGGHRSRPIPVIDRGPWPRMVGLANRLIPFDATHRACRLIRGRPWVYGCGTLTRVRWRVVGWERLHR